MEVKDLLKRRIFRLLLIVAWLALGTVMIALQRQWWVWFAAVSYVIAVVYIVAEVLTWRYAMRQKGTTAGQRGAKPPTSDGQSSNSG